MSTAASNTTATAASADSDQRRGASLSVPLVLLLVLAFNLARLACGFAFDLVPQEAYYFLYSQHLALSYFDHPPAIAYLIRLFTAVFGHREIALRAAAFVVTLATQLAWLSLARQLLPLRLWSIAALLFTSTGLITVTSLISTPDVPLLLFWTLSLHQLYRAVFEQRRASWLLGGLLMGLAFDSKYSGALLQVGLLLFLALSRSHRRWLKTPWPYLCLASAHLAMLPVYVWNAQHGFASFLFQSVDRAQAIGRPQIRYFLALLATQSSLVMPPLLIAFGRGIVRSPRLLRKQKSPLGQKHLFLACFFVPMAVALTALSFFALVKPNWLMPCYLSGLLWLAPMMRRWWKWNLAFAAAFHLAAAVELFSYVVPVPSDDTWFGWKELARQVSRVSADHPSAFVFSADGYKTSAELSFYLQAPVYGPNVIGQRGLQFDYLGEDLSHLQGRDGLLISSSRGDLSDRAPAPPDELARYFEGVEQLEPALIFKGSRLTRKFYVYLCRTYRGSPP